MITTGKVPHYKLRPNPGIMIVLLLTLISGGLLGMTFVSMDDGSGASLQKAYFVFLVTGVISVCLLIVATSKFWFPHLWKRNSTHDRHKQLSRRHAHGHGRHPSRRRR